MLTDGQPVESARVCWEILPGRMTFCTGQLCSGTSQKGAGRGSYPGTPPRPSPGSKSCRSDSGKTATDFNPRIRHLKHNKRAVTMSASNPAPSIRGFLVSYPLQMLLKKVHCTDNHASQTVAKKTCGPGFGEAKGYTLPNALEKGGAGLCGPSWVQRPQGQRHRPLVTNISGKWRELCESRATGARGP